MSDTAIVSEQSGETRSRGAPCIFERRRGGTDEEAVCLHRCEGIGARREGKIWFVPDSAPKPSDGRYKREESLIEQIITKKAELEKRRPLTAGELERLNQDFAIEYTYNSNVQCDRGQYSYIARNGHGAQRSYDRSKTFERPYGGGGT